MVENHFYHVCTDGTNQDWLFKDDNDFIAGINRIAVCSVISGVKVYKYVLMDNHTHFVLCGHQLQCKEFINKYKLLTGKWVSKRYGIKSFTADLPAQIIKITSMDYLLEVMAYLDRNAIKANFPYLPSEYKWGSSRYIFKDRSVFKGQKLSEISLRKQRELFNTHKVLPQEWEIFPDGMLNPLSFCQIDKVESLFKTPIRYIYFLAKKVEGKVEEDISQGNRTYIMDKDLRSIIETLVYNMFGSTDIKMLNMDARLKLARKLRYEYLSTPKQISRMLGISIEVVKEYV